MVIEGEGTASSFFATISEYNKRYLINMGVVAGKLRIVRCGVDAVQLEQRKNFVSHLPVKIGVVGRLVEKKRIDSLICAVSKLKKGGQQIQLFVAGSGPLENDLSALIKTEGLIEVDVHFLGAMPHQKVADFIKSLDVFVLPCKKDSQGDVFLSY